MGHDGLADAGVAAVELKALLRAVVLNFAPVAGDAALVSLRQVVDNPAEGGVAAEQIDIPALRVQDIGGQSGEYPEVGDQLAQLLLIKKNIQGYCLLP